MDIEEKIWAVREIFMLRNKQDGDNWDELCRLARLGAAVEAAWERYDMPNNRFTVDSINCFVQDCATALESRDE